MQPLCRCGCGREAVTLATGEDLDGSVFVDEPMCQSAADYCSESAYLLRLPITFIPIKVEQVSEADR